jgi:feruloyl esterase
MEAQRFPKDYEGIVAGAPANFWTRLLTNGVWTDQAFAATPDSWISPEKLSVVTEATLKACQGESGYLDDPRQCHFDPSSLLCTASETNECLSAPQVAALKKIYSGMQDASGKSVFPGYPPGGESGPVAWRLWLTGAEPKRIEGTLIYGFVTGYFADMVSDKPDWSFRGQNLADDLAQAEEKTGKAVDAADPDLSAFRDTGGKLIQYHGWNDAAIPAQSSIDYYEEVAAKMGGIEKTQSFYRLFMAPGMQHCGLGLGPNAVGGVFGLPMTPRMTSSRRSRTGSKTARRRIGSSQRHIAMMTRRRESRRSVLGARILRSLDIPARALAPKPRATPTRRPRSKTEAQR